MEQKILLIIITLGALAIIALVLGLVLGLKVKNEEKIPETKIEVVNSYDNTEELIKQFQVLNPTRVGNGMEKHIQNRL